MTHELFGPVISSYSRAQAIEDGVLVDITEQARQQRFVFPMAMTGALWDKSTAENIRHAGIFVAKNGCPLLLASFVARGVLTPVDQPLIRACPDISIASSSKALTPRK